jgi:hypothetical protein
MFSVPRIKSATRRPWRLGPSSDRLQRARLAAGTASWACLTGASAATSRAAAGDQEVLLFEPQLAACRRAVAGVPAFVRFSERMGASTASA